MSASSFKVPLRAGTASYSSGRTSFARFVVAGLLAAFFLVLSAKALPGVAHGATPAEAIAALNAQRAANGLPGDITEDPAWSEGCRLHMNYLRLNNYSGNWHDEVPGNPGYSDAGRYAAQNAVLTSAPWVVGENAFEYAPIHLAQMLTPKLSVTGFADGCFITLAGWKRTAPPALEVVSYPGNGATIYPAMTARERPFVPGDFVGLPEGTTTGPHLYIFGFGANTFSGRLSGASLTGPDGPVDVRSVDNHTSGPEGNLGPYLPAGGILIPAKPLRAESSYTAQVTYTSDRDGAQVTRNWTFRTKALRQANVTLTFDAKQFDVATNAPADGTFTVVRTQSGEVVYNQRVSGGGGLRGSLAFGPGNYRACLTQPADAEWAAVNTCREAAIAEPPPPTQTPTTGKTTTTTPATTPPRFPGGGGAVIDPAEPGVSEEPEPSRLYVTLKRGRSRATASIRVTGAAVGERARVSVRPMRCAGRTRRGCPLRVAGPSRSISITVGKQARRVYFPRGAIRVTVTVPAADLKKTKTLR